MKSVDESLVKSPYPLSKKCLLRFERKKATNQSWWEALSSIIQENSALVAIEVAASAAANAGDQGISKKAWGKGKIRCDHCNKQRHTRYTCWKLHGKTQNLKNSGRFQREMGPRHANCNWESKTITEASPFSKEELEHLYRLFHQSSSSNSLSSYSSAQTGKSLSALSVHSENFTSWIIDYSASDHMTSLLNLFSI